MEALSARRTVKAVKQICRLSCWLALVSLLGSSAALALDPKKALTQYSRSVWTRARGLPQDAISEIAQTTDGFLWLATDEGLARFDGYEMKVFGKDDGSLPSNSVRALAAGPDNTLWIGTSNGLTRYDGRVFRTFTTNDGLSDNAVSKIFVDHTGLPWIVAGGELDRFEGTRPVPFTPAKSLLFTPSTVAEDARHVIWVAGFSGLARLDGNQFVPVIRSEVLGGNLLTELVPDAHGNFWMGGTLGVVKRSPDGTLQKFDTRQGLPHAFVRALIVDRNGSVWVGTNAGYARLMGDRFVTLANPDETDRDLVATIFEDRENNLWLGSVNGLTRLRDDVFTAYGKDEGFPGDDPTTVHQSRDGVIWVGFHNSGLMSMSPEGKRFFDLRTGLPSNEVFSIRERRDGTLLVGTRGGLALIRDGKASFYRPPDQLGRQMVFDSLEDAAGRLWLALPSGLGRLENGKLDILIPGSPQVATWFVTLQATKDGSVWAGTYGKGLWRVKNEKKEHFTTADGLGSDQIRALQPQKDGALWIATIGGGLNVYRDGGLRRFTARDGMLTDNISNIIDDGDSLWLATPRGVSNIGKQQLADFAEGRIQRLQPTNYTTEDGLRSDQCSPGYPVAAGGSRTSDGRLWFPTSRGLAAIDPKAPHRDKPAPIIQPFDMTVDGTSVELKQDAQLRPGSDRIRIRYSAIHLAAPERVQYWQKLEGLDADWVYAGQRREINYNNLRHGKYRFLVRASLPGGPVAEAAMPFEELPEFYETVWARSLFAVAIGLAAWGIYQLRVRQLRYRFSLVLEERARLAREIHDTLAQGFIGISSQLEAVAATLPEDIGLARRYLDLARKMARHSITEARRAVSDLRASMLEGQCLEQALRSGAQIWTAGSGVEVDFEITGYQQPLAEETEQHLLRITQEAITNVLKHAGAKKILVKMDVQSASLTLRIVDDGHGFEPRAEVFSPNGGHFGLIGMRERAERLGGELRLASQPGDGTRIEVTVPLP